LIGILVLPERTDVGFSWVGLIYLLVIYTLHQEMFNAFNLQDSARLSRGNPQEYEILQSKYSKSDCTQIDAIRCIDTVLLCTEERFYSNPIVEDGLSQSPVL
jgi:hypothetical protein